MKNLLSTSSKFGVALCIGCGTQFNKKNSIHKYCTSFCKDKTVRATNRDLVHKYKLSMGCAICGYKENAVALHFDHITPADKAFNISLDYKRPIEQIWKEVEKCRVLCANCHAIETYNSNQYILDMSKRGYVSGNANYRRQTKRKSS